jgi:hypothetical protein
MRNEECVCGCTCGDPLACLKIDFDTNGAFCPECKGYVVPLGEGAIEEKIWKSELTKSYINQLSQHAGEGLDLSMNRLRENISKLAKELFTATN